MADIYGSQSDVLLQRGLAFAEDENDFDVKLVSLKNVWEKAASGFPNWFRKIRAQQFKESLIMSARFCLGISHALRLFDFLVSQFHNYKYISTSSYGKITCLQYIYVYNMQHFHTFAGMWTVNTN